MISQKSRSGEEAEAYGRVGEDGVRSGALDWEAIQPRIIICETAIICASQRSTSAYESPEFLVRVSR